MSVTQLAALTPDQLAAMSPDQLAAIVGAPDAPKAKAPDAVTQKVLANAPGKRADKSATTKAKVRTLTPLLVADGKVSQLAVGAQVPAEGVVFRVASTGHDGSMLRASRVAPFIDGRPQRTITVALLDALDDENIRDAIRGAIDTCDRAAGIGAYKAEVAAA